MTFNHDAASNESTFCAAATRLSATLHSDLRSLDASATNDDIQRLYDARDAKFKTAADECWPERSHLTAALVRETVDAARAQGRAIFNGCTSVWLQERFPSVRHQMGVGWYQPKTSNI